MVKDKNLIQQNKRIAKEKGLSEMMATSYDKLISKFNFLFTNVIQKTKKILNNNHKVLEIGCGTGIISLGIADQVNSVIAIDISPKMIEVAKQKAERLRIKNVRFEIADGYSLQYENDMFDVVVLSNILHIVKEPNTLLFEAYRLLKPKGYLVTLTDCYSEPTSFSMKFQIFIYTVMKVLGITYLNKFRKSDVLKLFEKNNYKTLEEDIVNISPVGYYVLGQK